MQKLAGEKTVAQDQYPQWFGKEYQDRAQQISPAISGQRIGAEEVEWKAPEAVSPEEWMNRGLTYYGKGLYDQAISDHNKALEINPKYAEAYFGRGSAYAERKGQYDQAISDFNRALEIDPRLAEAYYSRGRAYYDKGQHDQAISDYSRALEINPRPS